MSRINPLAAGAISLVDGTNQATSNRTGVLAHLPGLPASLAEAEALLENSKSLDPVVRETAIVTVLRRSPYELSHRLRPARLAGLSPDMFEAIEEEDWTEPSFSEEQKAAMRFAMMFDAGHGIPSPAFDLFAETFNDQQLVELAALCAHYGACARYAIALGYRPEGPDKSEGEE